MIVVFKNDERLFEEWRKRHKKGYVYSYHEGANESNKLHSSTCRYLWKGSHLEVSHQMAKVRICSQDLEELVNELMDNGIKGWDFCKVCRVFKLR